MATIEGFCAVDVYDPPVWSQGVKVTGAETIVFLSGQVAMDANGSVLHAGDFKAQAREALRAVQVLVEAAGGTIQRIVKLTLYLTDFRYLADWREVRQEFFPQKLPAATYVQVRALAHPDWLVEVEVIAVLCGGARATHNHPVGGLNWDRPPGPVDVWRSTGEGLTMAKIEPFCAPDVYDSPFWTQGIKVSRASTILFLSGQAAVDKNGGALCPGDFKAQAREVLRAIKALVEAAGGTVQQIVKLNIYVTDMRYLPDWRDVRQTLFGQKQPAVTLLEVSALAHPDWLIEIDGIAVI